MSWVVDLFLWALLLSVVGGLVYGSVRFCWKNLVLYKNTRGYILQEEEDTSTASFHAMKNKPKEPI